ncbi:MAG: hypothetical protein ACI8RZ_007407, partial [Myxococcota bacterium]
MANLNHPGRENPSESIATTLRRPKGEQHREATSMSRLLASLEHGGCRSVGINASLRRLS